LSEKVDVVCRFQGGHNAGHTIKTKDKKVVLHIIPSGIMHDNTLSLIGNGVVVCLQALQDEIEMLEKVDISVENKLKISLNAHVIFPYHKKLDILKEKKQNKESIGTTGKGIGPAYEDKIARRGIRIYDLLNHSILKSKLDTNVEYYNEIFTQQFGEEEVEVEEIMRDTINLVSKLNQYFADVKAILVASRKHNKTVLFEGAQGALLDISNGTYPYVTSSNTGLGGAITGTGYGWMSGTRILGITKAYTTRVGNGPFPTELFDSIGEYIAETGNEVGATTGRDRRCGWLDLVSLKDVINSNGITELCLTKIDVLDKLAEIKVCTEYMVNGEKYDFIPEGLNWEDATPLYKIFSGWDEDTVGIQEFEKLPKKTIEYIEYIQEFLSVKITIVSTGAQREHTIVR
jgi:adenylosuccinate synthase